MNRLQLFLANPHTTYAALAYVIAKVGCPLLAIWMPAHATQLNQSADIIEAAAVGWGLLMAGDSKPTAALQQPGQPEAPGTIQPPKP